MARPPTLRHWFVDGKIAKVWFKVLCLIFTIILTMFTMQYVIVYVETPQS